MKKEIIRNTLFSNKITLVIVEISYDKRKIKKYIKRKFKKRINEKSNNEKYFIKNIYGIRVTGMYIFDDYTFQDIYLTNYSHTGINENIIYDDDLRVVFYFKYEKIIYFIKISPELVKFNFIYEYNNTLDEIVDD